MSTKGTGRHGPGYAGIEFMADQDCRKCRQWKGCPGKDWYHWGEIRWCVRQIIWILRHADTFRAGEWVARHEESGESRQLHPEAYFVKAVLIIAEVEKRLETTGVAGKLLVAQSKVVDNLDMIDDEAWEALMYVSGWNPKAMPFKDWRKQRRYRVKRH